MNIYKVYPAKGSLAFSVVRILGRCSKASAVCSRAPGDVIHPFPWGVVDRRVNPWLMVKECVSRADALDVYYKVGIWQACRTCGEDRDSEDMQTCGCRVCPGCNVSYRDTDEDGLRFASSGAVAEDVGHETILCSVCWEKRRS